MTLEAFDHFLDDSWVVISISKEGARSTATPKQQPVVAGQPEIGIDQL